MTKRSNEDEDEEEEDASNCAKNHPCTEMGLVVAQNSPGGYVQLSGDWWKFDRNSKTKLRKLVVT